MCNPKRPNGMLGNMRLLLLEGVDVMNLHIASLLRRSLRFSRCSLVWYAQSLSKGGCLSSFHPSSKLVEGSKADLKGGVLGSEYERGCRKRRNSSQKAMQYPVLPFLKNLLMPLFLMGCFPVDFQEVKRPLRTKSVKRPIKVGKRPINEGKRPIKAKVLVGVSVGCLMGCFRAPPPWRKTAPLKRPIKRSMISLCFWISLISSLR